jgi:hypothetical protein
VVLFTPRGSNEIRSKYLLLESISGDESGLTILVRLAPSENMRSTPDPPGPPSRC